MVCSLDLSWFRNAALHGSSPLTATPWSGASAAAYRLHCMVPNTLNIYSYTGLTSACNASTYQVWCRHRRLVRPSHTSVPLIVHPGGCPRRRVQQASQGTHVRHQRLY